MSYETFVISLGRAAMRTRTGFCYRNADSRAAQAVAFPDTAKQGKQVQIEKSGTWSERKRRGACYRRGEEDGRGDKWKQARAAGVETAGAAAAPCDGDAGGAPDLFGGLPDDIVVCILCRLSSSSSAPADLANVVLTCKRMRNLLLNPLVLAKASGKALAVRASKWSDAAQRFLKMCADAGNLEACYILGMIRFYCLQNRGAGASLMARAAIGSHAAALYSLAVIHFNGSGASKNDKDLRGGIALCYRAAFLGNIDALRELGHCLQDGYGVRQNVTEGRRFLVQANARELASVVPASQPRPTASPPPWITAWTQHAHRHRHRPVPGCPILGDFSCNVGVPEPHPANRFLAEWFSRNGSCRVSYEGLTGLRLCCHVGCGRPETRRHEFRRCSVCGAVNYCSRACQALDWKLRHKYQCAAPMERGLP